MPAAKLVVVLLLSIVLLASASVVLADGRVALVVGNSTYAHIGRLPNPANDAAAVSGALRRLGFEVTTTLDAGFAELNQALRTFTRRSAGSDVALVFYVGHGLEMDGVNYVVPVDARLERDVDVRYETTTLEDLVASTVGASLRLVILDACRNNPLARSMQRTVARRSVSGGSFEEFDEDLLGNETLVAYTAAAGTTTTAADGRGRNSPYTAALLSHLETPLEIGLLFRRVRAQVLAATNGAQRPHEHHSLVGEHYLTRTLPTGASVTVTAMAPVEPPPADPPRPGPPATNVTELSIPELCELAEAGVAAAQTELGERYQLARDVEQDYRVAASWFRRAADQGHAPGQAALGFLYSRGLGVERNDAEAVRWYRRAADQGNTRAQNNIGVLYGAGRGVERDDAEAVRWYRRTADQGHALAQNNLGVRYRDGRGVGQDYREAVRWFRRSAEQGHAGGQNNLGVMYGTGRGVNGTPRTKSVGIVVRLSRATSSRSPTSAGCTRTAGEYGVTMQKQCAGTVVPPSRAMSTRSMPWAYGTRTVAACAGIGSKPFGGTGWQPSRETPMLGMHWTVFDDLGNLNGTGVLVRLISAP